MKHLTAAAGLSLALSAAQPAQALVLEYRGSAITSDDLPRAFKALFVIPDSVAAGFSFDERCDPLGCTGDAPPPGFQATIDLAGQVYPVPYPIQYLPSDGFHIFGSFGANGGSLYESVVAYNGLVDIMVDFLEFPVFPNYVGFVQNGDVSLNIIGGAFFRVPEPASAALLLASIMGLAGVRRRQA